MSNTKEFLAHHGVKGMRWGIRKRSVATKSFINEATGQKSTVKYDPKKTSFNDEERAWTTSSKREARRIRKFFKENQKPEATLAAKPAKASLKDISDTELRSRINRLQMEQQYAQLTGMNTTRGKNFITETLKTSGKQVFQQATTKAMSAALSVALGKAAEQATSPATKQFLETMAKGKNK